MMSARVLCVFSINYFWLMCRVQMVCGIFLVASLIGDLRLLCAMIQISRGEEILQVVWNFSDISIFYFIHMDLVLLEVYISGWETPTLLGPSIYTRFSGNYDVNSHRADL